MSDPRSESKNDWLNLNSINPNKPCPICGTIVAEIRNKRINEVYSRIERRKYKFWVCSICTQLLVDPPKSITKQKQKKDSKPRGWALKKMFVDQDGNYFEKGTEIPELKGKYPPTTMTTKKKTVKKKSFKKRDKTKIINTANIVISDFKKQLEKESNTKNYKQLEKNIRELTKLVSGSWPSNHMKIIEKFELLH